MHNEPSPLAAHAGSCGFNCRIALFASIYSIDAADPRGGSRIFQKGGGGGGGGGGLMVMRGHAAMARGRVQRGVCLRVRRIFCY